MPPPPAAFPSMPDDEAVRGFRQGHKAIAALVCGVLALAVSAALVLSDSLGLNVAIVLFKPLFFVGPVLGLCAIVLGFFGRARTTGKVAVVLGALAFFGGPLVFLSIVSIGPTDPDGADRTIKIQLSGGSGVRAPAASGPDSPSF